MTAPILNNKTKWGETVFFFWAKIIYSFQECVINTGDFAWGSLSFVANGELEKYVYKFEVLIFSSTLLLWGRFESLAFKFCMVEISQSIDWLTLHECLRSNRQQAIKERGKTPVAKQDIFMFNQNVTLDFRMPRLWIMKDEVCVWKEHGLHWKACQ